VRSTATKALVVVIFVLGAIGLSNEAAAQIDPATDPAETRAADLETARGLALGGGARASAVSSSALAYNPAGLALARQYHIEAQTLFSPQFGRWTFGGHVIDSNTNKLAAGMSFVGTVGNGERGYSGMDGRVGLAFPIIPQLAIGISGRYLSLGREGEAPVGSNPNAPLAQGFTMDGSIAIAIDMLRIAAIAQNFIDIGSLLTPLRVGGGASLLIGDFLSLNVDALGDLNTFENPELLFGAGVEFLAGGIVPLRAGYRFDSGRGTHAVTGGLGYVDNKFGIELALRQEVGGTELTEVMLGLRYFVQ
jgi:hypothetical protein